MMCATMQEVVSLPAMESLCWIRCKVILIDRFDGGWLQRWIAVYQLVKQLSVICYDIGDLVAVLQSAFYLKGSDACFNHFGKVQTTVHILQRE